MKKIDFDKVVMNAAKLPLVKVDRTKFLKKELSGRYSKDVVELAIKYNPAYAGIKVDDINRIAKSCINLETAETTVLSAAAGIPGGFAMLATVPADLIQYEGHILKILQKLIYLYGWPELDLGSELNDETNGLIMLFNGVMFGVKEAIDVVNKVGNCIAINLAKQLPKKSLTKGVVYPIVKKISKLLGIKMTKIIFGESVGKIVPLVGGLVSGGLSLATFKPMAERLQKYLASYQFASTEFMGQIRNGKIVEVDYESA